MKRLLNTLYVTTQGSYLSRDGETVVVNVERKAKLQLPVHTLGGIVCFGQVSCSPPLMELCAENNVAISFFSEHGKFFARVQGPVSGNVLLRREQYRRADDETASVEIASSVIMAKIANCRTIILRASREELNSEKNSSLQAAAKKLVWMLKKIDKSMNLENLRGFEGSAAGVYFGVFDNLILAQKDYFQFKERSRRPPLDNINALLSFLYTLLAHDVTAALEGVGLDPAVGFLHRDRPGRPSLALDIMEEFRPFIADRLALNLINRQQIKGKGFRKTESGAVLMTDETRKEVLIAYQKRKQDEINHPFLDEKVSIGLLAHCQAMLLARYIRGDLDGYPPFIYK
ncbi:type I-C CRISPR-associated endonuclease Cas1c [bacterium]|nr:type I-C CRISPR-associated endonuclease Cas1 [bacterium]MBU3954829.1 type I-C CRISPR-associated endonuclease Cas1c [bacterium]